LNSYDGDEVAIWLEKVGDVGSSRGRTEIEQPEASGSGAVAAAPPAADTMDTSD